jgi:hypothetical protein
MLITCRPRQIPSTGLPCRHRLQDGELELVALGLDGSEVGILLPP